MYRVFKKLLDDNQILNIKSNPSKDYRLTLQVRGFKLNKIKVDLGVASYTSGVHLNNDNTSEVL